MKAIDVVISGAGQAGLTLACLLAQAGFNIAVIDPKLRTHTTNRTAAIMNHGVDLLTRIGCWDDVARYTTRMEALRILDYTQPTPITANFPSSDLGIDQFGFNTPLEKLHTSLWKTLRTFKNVICFETSIKRITEGTSSLTLHLENKKEIVTKILIGADGRASRVRELWRIPVWEHDYQQTALTGYITHSKDHECASTEIHYNGGPFTLVPLNGNTSSFVWLERTSDAQDLLRLNRAQFLHALQNKSKDILGKLELSDGPQSWPIIAQRAKTLIAPRTALIAEAAHVLTPLGAQGLNLSLRDVEVLFDLILTAAKTGQDIGGSSVLKSYESSRKRDINPRLFGTHGLSRALVHDNPILHDMRRIGLEVVKNLTPLKLFLMRQGLSPDYIASKDFTTRATVTTSTRKTPAA
jgi:2-octaprenyl-6-methoxyphenol hydroxylase